MQNVNVKAFFDTPETDVSRLCSRGTDSREINTNFGSRLKILKDIVGNVKIAVNAVKMNTPLAFYHKEVVNFDYDIEGAERALWDVIDFALKPRFDGPNKIWRLFLHSNNVFNLFFSIAIAKSFKKFVNTLSEVVEVGELIKVFSDMYEKAGVEANIRFLQRDVEGLKENVPDGFKGLYIECFDKGGSKDEKRNFFAHSGFLREITVVERKGDKIFVKWDENSLKKVRNWLKDPK
jgi:CRISPR-associated protein Csx1